MKKFYNLLPLEKKNKANRYRSSSTRSILVVQNEIRIQPDLNTELHTFLIICIYRHTKA